MNHDIAMRWADALESGAYAQGRGRLARQGPMDQEPCYCCLGVLCELLEAPKHTGDAPEDICGESVTLFYYSDEFGNSESGVLPEGIKAKVGMASDNGQISEGSDVALSVLNDRGTSFAEIARLIRARWREL